MMRRGWLASADGINFVAFGLTATGMSALWFVYMDVWFLLTDDPTVYRNYLDVWYLILAAAAAVFCAVTVFVWRPLMPKIVAGLLAAAMASQVTQRIFGIQAQHIKPLAAARLIISVGVILLLLNYRRVERRRAVNSR